MSNSVLPMRMIIFIILLFPLCANAEAENWTPEINFKLEAGDNIQTLAWVSGVSYTVSAIKNKSAANLCGVPKSIGSRQLLEYLNKSHAGAVITAEQAIDTLFKNLEAEYPCK